MLDIYWYLLVLCLSISLYSASVNLLVTKPYINVEYMGCNPSDTTNCYLVNFKFNNSIVSTSGGKYQITNTSFPVILRVLNVGPSDAGTYQCTFKCSGVDVSSSAVYLPFACKSTNKPHLDSHVLAFVYTVPPKVHCSKLYHVHVHVLTTYH